MAAFWRFFERLVIAAILCVLAVSAGVAALTAPWFTRVLTARIGVASSSGLSARQAADTAEVVRRFVTTADAASLPSTVAGRSGFDSAASSHLEDVRDVFLALRVVGVALALVILMWLVVAIRRRRFTDVASALRWGGCACFIAPIAVAALGLVDFDALFTALHGLFFAEGTWTFAADSLLIELFPERFWIVAGVSLALLVVVQGAILWICGKSVEMRQRRRLEQASA